MIRGKVKIKPTTEGKSYTQKEHLRLAFNFGDDLIFTGAIKGNHAKYECGMDYDVDVDFFTVDDEAYAMLKPKLKKGMKLVICEGKRIRGVAHLLDYTYQA
jgi:hypothetical protein